MYKIEKLETFLPCFNGFYGQTNYWINNPDYEYMLFDNPNNVNDSFLDIIKENIYDCFDYSELENQIKDIFINEVEYALKELGIIESLKFESISKPREYNFTNDSFNVTIINVNVTKMFKLVNVYKQEYIEFLEENYKSRSGFNSFYDYDYIEVLKTVFNKNIDNGKKQNYISMTMEFLLNKESKRFTSDYSFEESIWDVCFESLCFSDFIEYEKLEKYINDFFESENIEYTIESLQELENLNIEELKNKPEYQKPYFCKSKDQLALSFY